MISTFTWMPKPRSKVYLAAAASPIARRSSLGVIAIWAASSSTGIAAGIVSFIFVPLLTSSGTALTVSGLSQDKVALDAVLAKVVAELTGSTPRQRPKAAPERHHPEDVDGGTPAAPARHR